MKTVSELLQLMKGKEDYEIAENYSGSFDYEGSLDFNLDYDEKCHTYVKDLINMVKNENIPLDTEICIWDNDDYHSWSLTGEGFVVDDIRKLVVLICHPFSQN